MPSLAQINFKRSLHQKWIALP